MVARRGEGSLGWTCTIAIFKMDNQQGPTVSSEQGRRKEPNKTQICKCSHKSPRSSSQSQNAANLSYLFLPHHQQLEESQLILFSQLKDQANISSNKDF